MSKNKISKWLYNNTSDILRFLVYNEIKWIAPFYLIADNVQKITRFRRFWKNVYHSDFAFSLIIDFIFFSYCGLSVGGFEDDSDQPRYLKYPVFYTGAGIVYLYAVCISYFAGRQLAKAADLC